VLLELDGTVTRKKESGKGTYSVTLPVLEMTDDEFFWYLVGQMEVVDVRNRLRFPDGAARMPGGTELYRTPALEEL